MKTPFILRNRGGLFGSRGSILIITAILMPIIIGFAALAIDIGYVAVKKAQQDNAVAAAALACQSGISDILTTPTSTKPYDQAILYASKNNLTLANSNIQLGKWDVSTARFKSYSTPYNACQVTKTVSTSTLFGKAFSIGSFTKTSLATATYGIASASQSMNLVMTQDLTGSFSQELAQAKTADQALLNCISTKRPNGTTVALSAFAYTSTTLTPLQDISSGTTGYTAFQTAINSLQTIGSSNINGSQNQTNIMTAIAGAAKQLTDKNSTGAQNAIVIVTDGEANMRTPVPPTPTQAYTSGAYSTYPKNALPSTAPAPPTPSPPAYYTGKKNGNTFDQAWLAYWESYWGDNQGNTTGYWDVAGKNYCTNGLSCALKASQAACAAGYKIYAIYYNSGNGGNTSNVKNLTCDPSLPDNQYFFNNPNSVDLAASAQKICYDMLSPSLVYQR